MTTRNFSNWLTAFTEYASFGEAPPWIYKWVGVSTIAGAVRRQVWLDMGFFEWIPNFYIVIVAPPGIVSKSTTASIGMTLLRDVPGIKFGPEVVTWPALVQKMAQSLEQFVDPLTGEYVSMTAVTIESSEFGNLLNPNDREMVDIYVSLWDGKKGAMTKLTKTQGEDTIVNPFVNIIACTTPAWIAGNFPEYMIGGGFTSRCIFVFAEEKYKYVAYPGLVMPENNKTEVKNKLIQDLEIISRNAGGFIMTPEAIQWGEQWYVSHYQNVPPYLNNDRFGGYIARKQSHLHKLAMVLSLAESNTLVIDKHHLEEALEDLSKIEKQMPKVFAQIGKTEDARKAEAVLNIIRALSPIEWSELIRQCFSIEPQSEELSSLVTSFIKGGLVSMNQTEKGVYITYVRGVS